MNEETIFGEATQRADPAERAAFLEAACGGDKVLRRRVEALLSVHEAGGSFLEPLVTPPATGVGEAPLPNGAGPAAENAVAVSLSSTEAGTSAAGAIPAGRTATAAFDAPSRPRTSASGEDASGTVIGPYKLLEPIGEGGMGVVYMAEQTQPVRRKVALKLIKPGMDTKQVIARFEAERQALALMDHPNIAKVHDAGAADSGRPYFVMELVKGVPITRYCDEKRLTPRERLELFIPVCQAIQHAHQKGIIHRDLKPSNVLVGLYDGKPVPKVIDFGVAKAAGPKLTEATLFTAFGTVIGTPEYMSPEQAQLENLDIDTRSDIYSLGVLLYELLTGTTPFTRKELEKSGMLEMLRVIREQEPTKPSTKLSAAEGLPTLAANRGTEPTRLKKLESGGELDWIVMKCLEKDRGRRYVAANSLAMDLQRYLADESVLAYPPSTWYRLRKLVRRHRGPVLGMSLVALTLVAGIIGTTWGMLRATKAEADAVNETKLKETALTAAQDSERARAYQLWQALVAQARANRLSRRAGQRFETLEILRRATELARSLDLPKENFHELRNAVIATLSLPDLHLTGPWNPWPADADSFDFDEAHAIYARTNRKGNCSIRRVADDVEIHQLPGTGYPRLSRDGKFVAIVEQNKAFHLWQLDGVTPRRLLSDAKVWAVDFHRNGQQVALTYNDGAIGVFELPSGRQLTRLPPETLTRELTIALHPKEPVFAALSYLVAAVQLRELTTGKLLGLGLPQAASPPQRRLAPGLAGRWRSAWPMVM